MTHARAMFNRRKNLQSISLCPDPRIEKRMVLFFGHTIAVHQFILHATRKATRKAITCTGHIKGQCSIGSAAFSLRSKEQLEKLKKEAAAGGRRPGRPSGRSKGKGKANIFFIHSLVCWYAHRGCRWGDECHFSHGKWS
jgi:hypothetical protein